MQDLSDFQFSYMSTLPRKLGLFSAVAVLVGSTIGSGIFRSPAGIAERIPNESLFFLAWIIRGVSISAFVQNMTASAKYLALLALVAASFILGKSAVSPASAVTATSGTSISSFGLALISILWVYDGWADVTFVSGEVKRPE